LLRRISTTQSRGQTAQRTARRPAQSTPSRAPGTRCGSRGWRCVPPRPAPPRPAAPSAGRTVALPFATDAAAAVPSTLRRAYSERPRVFCSWRRGASTLGRFLTDSRRAAG
jgi:hypothetical protein